jgi:hypothetical protein
MQVIRCLLIEPFPESALNEEAGKMLMEDYEGYAKHARYSPYTHVEYYFWKVSTFFSSKVCIDSSFTIHVWAFPL